MGGTMPDDAWLAALYAECEALFGDDDGRHGLDAPPEPEWCEAVPGGLSDSAADLGPVELWPVEVLREALTEAPGAELARVVAEYTGLGGSAAVEDGAAPLAALSDDMLGELVGACARLQSWAAGVQAHAVAERASRESSPLAHNSLVGQVTAELVVTQAEGSEVVVRAESGAEHPTVIEALVAGRIDVKKAHTLLRAAAQLTVVERAEAIARYLPQAPFRTWRWLRNKMLAFAKARHGAEETARAAALDRNVQLDRAENDMGWLSAYLPAVDAAAVWGVVDDMAHQLRYTAGEERTLGQLRADCLTGIVTGRLVPGDRFTTTYQAEGATTTSDGMGNGAGLEGGASAEGDDAGPICTCGGRAPVVHETVVRVAPSRPVVRVTVPASTLLGLDDAPADLDGFGPVPAEVARLLAEDATWQRLLTDPVTGVLTDYSTTTYKPGRVLRSAVEARDGTCTFVGCDAVAVSCDLDHIEPFDYEQDVRHSGEAGAVRGQTRADNLHALCRRHHLLKTHAGWGVVRDPNTGITTWTTPSGGTHTRPSTILDTRVDLGNIDPATSGDLTLRALTGRRLPRAYVTAAPTAGPSEPIAPSGPGEPPF
ncbi:HNH endonuclease signature motif containing protein [Promicromonospora sukumoe]|uniref:HNH endonuclease signature motif containing protein n=1 Tax=Promicromonospora sukumoe TaxID=88382 RepID=UPI001E3F9766|nr:HNH endonuclease signature motif containing protein [Promicromonospora sukumoe]